MDITYITDWKWKGHPQPRIVSRGHFEAEHLPVLRLHLVKHGVVNGDHDLLEEGGKVRPQIGRPIHAVLSLKSLGRTMNLFIY